MYAIDRIAERRQRYSWGARGVSRLLVPPIDEPVGLDLFKLHTRVSTAEDDDAIVVYLKAARAWLETYTGRALYEQSWGLTLDAPPASDADILLPRSPLVSVTSVKSYSAATVPVETTMAASGYFVDTGREPARLILNGVSWPSDIRAYNAIQVTYVAGYGASDDAIPPEFRQAICLLAAHWYGNREASGADLNEIPFGIKALIDSYRVMAD